MTFNFFKSIRGKLFMLIFAATFAFSGLAIYSYSQIGVLEKQILSLGSQRIPLSDTMADLRASSNATPRYMWLAWAYPPGSPERSKHLESARRSWALLQSSVERYGQFDITSETRERVNRVMELIPALKEAVEPGIEKMVNSSKEQDLIVRELLMQKMPPAAVKISGYVAEMSKTATERNKAIVEEAQKAAAYTQKMMLAVSSVIGIFLIIIGYVFATRLSRHLLRITKSVGDASEQVASASGQLSNAAEQLSSASQQQASSIEESSSSLAQISSMIEANSKGAEDVNDLAQNVQTVSENTRKSMEDLSSAMKSILDSNGRIEKLVKVISEIGEKTEVIDDIVFKTQLLSFNASVEAERAGEHGRGFAVVAQEVGNLAQMSGRAATEISAIVKNSIKEAEEVAKENRTRVEFGNQLAVDTKVQMNNVTQQLTQILESTHKIVAASKEQSIGINQITSAVENLNQTTQETASTSEESASASAELAGQAEALLALVSELHHIVAGIESTKHESNHNKTYTVARAQPKSNVLSYVAERRPKKILRKVAGVDYESGASFENGHGKNNDEWEQL